MQQILSRRHIFNQSWPIMLANGAAPLVGLVDTLMVGRFIGTSALAGIGLGALIYGVFYWGFGFLRMSTAGLSAQSDGAGDAIQLQAHLFRAVPIGLFIGLSIVITQSWLLPLALQIYTAAPEIEQTARHYISARLWGLPATLGTIALMGWFIGISRAPLALAVQIILNLVNLMLSPLFVIGLGAGLYWVGLASAIAEWAGFIAAIFLAIGEIKRRGGVQRRALSKNILLDKTAIAKLGVANGNIFIRTLCLTIGFNFFGNAAASQGETFLAGYHILMQMVTMAALVLDGFAHSAEAATGAAFGAKDKPRFQKAVRLTFEFSGLFAIICGGLILFLGPFLISALTADIAVQQSARAFLPFCALAPIIGFCAYEFDGIFIGTTQTRAMRDAGIIALIGYIGLHYLIVPSIGPRGIWIAFLGYYAFRGITLAIAYPAIYKSMDVKRAA